MTRVHFEPSERFQPLARRVFAEAERHLRTALPDAAIEDRRATAIRGLVTKGDVGINVRVPAREFAAAVAFVSERYDIHQPQNWSSEMTTYRRAKRRFLVQHLEA